MPPLKNVRHEKFVQGLLEGKSATDAYEAAGYERDESGANAARLTRNPKVAQRLAELQAEIAAETTVTVQGLINELEDARKKATDLKQLNAAIAAINAKAKLSGLMVEKQQIEVGGPGSFDGMWDAREIALKAIDGMLELKVESYHDFTEADREHLAELFQQSMESFNKAFNEYVQEIRARPLKSSHRQPKALPDHRSNGQRRY